MAREDVVQVIREHVLREHPDGCPMGCKTCARLLAEYERTTGKGWVWSSMDMPDVWHANGAWTYPQPGQVVALPVRINEVEAEYALVLRDPKWGMREYEPDLIFVQVLRSNEADRFTRWYHVKDVLRVWDSIDECVNFVTAYYDAHGTCPDNDGYLRKPIVQPQHIKDPAEMGIPMIEPADAWGGTGEIPPDSYVQ